MGDASEVFKGIKKNPEITYSALVPNIKGLEAAIKSDVKEIALFTAASNTFCKKNTNCTMEESLKNLKELAKKAKEINKDLRIRG